MPAIRGSGHGGRRDGLQVLRGAASDGSGQVSVVPVKWAGKAGETACTAAAAGATIWMPTATCTRQQRRTEPSCRCLWTGPCGLHRARASPLAQAQQPGRGAASSGGCC
ncbi:hypothetical protein ABPG75_003195 [Micractinium tetrahymenae]